VDSTAGRIAGCEMTQPKQTRAEIAVFFIRQLDTALARSAATLSKLYQKGLIPKALEGPITDLYEKSVTLTDEFMKNPASIKRDDQKNAKALRDELTFFKSLYLDNQLAAPARVTKCLNHISADIDHFLRNFAATQHSFAPGSKLPHRPQKTAERLEWFNIVQSLEKATGKFPRHSLVYPEMKKAGHTLSAETHGDWKKRYVNGSF
jgi:hypothetical protein